MKSFFPNNAVEYFVSYYDYYTPEAYVPRTDTYIEKESSINEQIDRMRHSATRALLERKDTVVRAVAAVSREYRIRRTERRRSKGEIEGRSKKGDRSGDGRYIRPHGPQGGAGWGRPSRARDGRAADWAPLDVRVGQCRCERGKCVRSGQHRQGAGLRLTFQGSDAPLAGGRRRLVTLVLLPERQKLGRL